MTRRPVVQVTRCAGDQVVMWPPDDPAALLLVEELLGRSVLGARGAVQPHLRQVQVQVLLQVLVQV